MCVDPRTPATIVLPRIVGESTPVPPARSRGRSEPADSSFTVWAPTHGPCRRQAPDGRKGFRFTSDPAVPSMVHTLAVRGQIPDRIGQTNVVVLRLRSSLALWRLGVRSGAWDARLRTFSSHF